MNSLSVHCAVLSFALVGIVRGEDPQQIASTVEAARLNLSAIQRFDVCYSAQSYADQEDFGYNRLDGKYRLICDLEAGQALFIQKEYHVSLQPDTTLKEKLANSESDVFLVTLIDGRNCLQKSFPGELIDRQVNTFDEACERCYVPNFHAVGFTMFPPRVASSKASTSSTMSREERFFKELELTMSKGRLIRGNDTVRIVADKPTLSIMLHNGEIRQSIGDTIDLSLTIDNLLPQKTTQYRNGMSKGVFKRVRDWYETYNWIDVNGVPVIASIASEIEAMHSHNKSPTMFQRQVEYRFRWLSVNGKIDSKMFDRSIVNSVDRINALLSVNVHDGDAQK